MHQCVSRISGHPCIALYNLGGYYFAGKGVEQSFENASECFQQAADIGFAPCRSSSGMPRSGHSGFVVRTGYFFQIPCINNAWINSVHFVTLLSCYFALHACMQVNLGTLETCTIYNGLGVTTNQGQIKDKAKQRVLYKLAADTLGLLSILPFFYYPRCCLLFKKLFKHN